MNINVFLKSKLDAVATSNIIGKTNESNSTILKFYFKEEPGDNLFFLDIEKIIVMYIVSLGYWIFPDAAKLK